MVNKRKKSEDFVKFFATVYRENKIFIRLD